MPKLKKIFIAGGAGFIGSHLSHSFTELGHEVMIYDGNVQYFYPASKLSIKSINKSFSTLTSINNSHFRAVFPWCKTITARSICSLGGKGKKTNEHRPKCKHVAC